jgi:hypothetical protein
MAHQIIVICTQSALADCAYKCGPLHLACAACTHIHAATKPEQGALADCCCLTHFSQSRSDNNSPLFVCKSTPAADGGAMFEQCKYLKIHPKDETFWMAVFIFALEMMCIKTALFSSLTALSAWKINLDSGILSTQYSYFLEEEAYYNPACT